MERGETDVRRGHAHGYEQRGAPAVAKDGSVGHAGSRPEQRDPCSAGYERIGIPRGQHVQPDVQEKPQHGCDSQLECKSEVYRGFAHMPFQRLVHRSIVGGPGHALRPALLRFT